MKLATKRLLLRPFTLGDIDAVHEYSTSLEVTRFMEWGPNTYEDTKAFVENVVNNNDNPARLDHDFLVTLKDGTVIGACSLNFKTLDTAPSLGWVYLQNHWNNGYATEAAIALLGYAFKTLELRKVVARCDVENIASARVMEKAGMRYVGEEDYIHKKLGKRRQKLYELSALEYRLNTHKTLI